MCLARHQMGWPVSCLHRPTSVHFRSDANASGLLEVLLGDLVDGEPVGDYVAGLHSPQRSRGTPPILVGVPDLGLEVDAVVLRAIVDTVLGGVLLALEEVQAEVEGRATYAGRVETTMYGSTSLSRS